VCFTRAHLKIPIFCGLKEEYPDAILQSLNANEERRGAIGLIHSSPNELA
jgi:hypothetical protein